MNIIVENILDGIRIEEYIQWFNSLYKCENVKKLQIHFVSEEKIFKRGARLNCIQRDEKMIGYPIIIPLLTDMNEVMMHTRNRINDLYCDVVVTTLYYNDIKNGTAINTIVTKI